MKKFRLSVDTGSSRDTIHFEEVMFLASLKSSLPGKVCSNIYMIEVILADNSDNNMVLQQLLLLISGAASHGSK